MLSRWIVLAAVGAAGITAMAGPDANRLTYLDANDPFHTGTTFPKLTTPQWVGDSSVEAVVILAIDDMREPQKYEAFLRPILERLKQIDGRAPVSIFCNQLDPQNPQLQSWLREGLSFEVHTLTHPCPLLASSNFVAAATNYHDCVDLLNRIPGGKPVAFRMPCCDSMNSPSPRFYAELFNHASSEGRFLTMDSSVMNVTTADDKSLPRELLLDRKGRSRFEKYFPTETNAVTRLSLKWFGTTIENYPYPYVIGRLCWEFPAMTPSDWEAFNTHGPTNSATVADWKAALDATVLKQGTFTFIFHPHGWIQPGQLVEFIDYAVAKYAGKVKFLTFREAQERLDQHLLAGQPLRAAKGEDNGVRLVDVDNDGYLDVVIGNDSVRKTRLWDAKNRRWNEQDFPVPLIAVDGQGKRFETGVRFGVTSPDGNATVLVRNENVSGAWRFDGNRWVEEPSLLTGLELEGDKVFTSRQKRDLGVRFRDVDRDGRCELIVSNDKQNVVFTWSSDESSWKKLPYALPSGVSIVDERGRDNGLRFVDLNEDGYDDILFSNERVFALHLFIVTPKTWLGWERGWSFKVASGERGQPGAIPMIVRGGANPDNGVWFHGKQMWVQNEETAHLPDKVERHAFSQLLSIAEPAPKSPQESLAALRVRPGFQAELVASEPLVIDPVAFDWGPDGKLWVVEMRDYPLGIDGHGKSGGVIKYLEDTDGDGRYDKATIFLEGVNFPNGVMAWRKGVIVSAAPEIFYAEDTDGDGKADVRTPILVGFNQGNQQHRINGFEYGLDNWVYAANGGSSGTIRSVRTGKTADLRGHDLRFKPDTGEFELVEGQTQFGRRRDDWGNWFGNENPTWLWHYLLPERYLARNPNLAVRTTRQVLANYPEPTRVFPIGQPQQRFNWPNLGNNVTSANSATPYRDSLFGADFATSVFVSEPAQNVVHREVLEPSGVTFTSHRASDEQDREFLASSDNWFRPTMLKTGPDGALYIADMYRLVIEHPEYFPDELKHRPDLRAGDDKGRIYRVYPNGAKLRAVPRLDQLSVSDLVRRLSSANGWERDMAQRLLIQRPAQQSESELLRITTKDWSPVARIQLLSTIDGRGMLTPALVNRSLGDGQAAVREFAVRLSERFLAQASGRPPNSRLVTSLINLVNDPGIRVRRQLAFSLGEWNDPRAGRTLASLVIKDRDNPFVETAVLSSATHHVNEILDVLFANAGQNPPPARVLSQLIAMATAANDTNSVANVLRHLAAPASGVCAPWQMAALIGFLDALDRRGISLSGYEAQANGELKEAIQSLTGVFSQARHVADSSGQLSNSESLAEMEMAIELLGRGLSGQSEDIDRLGALLRPQVEGPNQQAALAALGRLQSPRVGRVLSNGWKTYSPALRVDVLNVLLSRSEWIQELLNDIQSGAIAPAELGPFFQQRLMTHSDERVRERAQQFFAARKSDRQAIVKDYDAVNALSGDPARGANIYRQNCAACHRLRDEGNAVGPDLATIADKPIGTLLVAILDPNQAFETKYINYTALTKGGREISGIISAETPNSLTLRNAGGKDEVVFRSDIQELNSSRLSLMPEGFESVVKPQDMADLIAFIRMK